MKLINNIKNSFNNSSDLIIKKINNIYLIYLQSICDTEKINDFIIRNYELNKSIITPNSVLINEKDITNNLLQACTIIIDNKKIYSLETKGNLIRSIDKSSYETSINGSKDSLNESIENNLGLIKRRIKSNNLINEDYYLGDNTKTKVSLLYLKDITDMKLVNKIKNKLNYIKSDIISIENIKQLLTKENRSVLPTIMVSERPDIISNYLLDKKVIIICDNSPNALILPTYLVDYINPNIDSYNKSISINFIKIIRLFCLLFTVCAPALYIAIINYDSESLPISLLINFANQRQSVPFPSYIECLIMLILCSILKESDMRFSSSYSTSISIVGALILGDASVAAGLISPIMIIIISFTFISSLIFSDIEFVNGLRIYRFILLFFSTFLGLLGFNLGLLIIISNLCSLKVLGNSFTYPISPFNKKYFNKTIIKRRNNY